MSGQSQEIELKLRVDSAEDLEKVCAIAPRRGDEGLLRQTNHFFDSHDRHLRQRGIVLRLRKENERFIVAAKGAAQTRSTSGVLAVRLEEEAEVSSADADAMLAGDRSPLTALPPDLALVQTARAALSGVDLLHLGSFENVRRTLPSELALASGALAVLFEADTTTFPGGDVHWELEVELPADVSAADAEAALRDLFAQAGVVGRPARGKASRFFAALATGDPDALPTA